MSLLLQEFQQLLKESNQFPKDELREYYLVPANTMLNSNPQIAQDVFEDKTALMMVIEQLVVKNNHPIRQIHLNMLAMDIVEKTPKELLNYQNIDGNSAIHMTTKMECFSVGVLDLMKEKGANFSLINKNGETPLIKVAATPSLDDLKFIHAYTIPRLLDHRDLITGSTALLHAIQKRKINNIFFLLQSGASLFVRDNHGLTALDIIHTTEYRMKSDKNYYEELEHILNLFSQKQLAEQTLKNLSNG